jgi:hypothetical protein
MTRRDILAAGGMALSLPRVLGGQNCPASLAGAGIAKGLKPDTALRSLEIGAVTAPQAEFDNVDADLIMRTAHEAGVQCVMLYSMEHWGYALYDTKIGYKHPNLKYDLMARQVEAARKYGLSPLCYYSFNFAQVVAEHHPDWRMLNEKGEPFKFGDRFWLVCQNSPYGEFMLDTFDELFGKYKFDGLFLDIYPAKPTFNSVGSDESPFCFCPWCLQLWEKETGTGFRSGLDQIPARRERLAWTRQKSGPEFIARMRAVIQKHVPNATLAGNGGCLFYWKNLIDALDYNYGEPEFSRSGVCLGGAMMRGWGKPLYQEGVWLRDQRTVADQVPPEILKAEGASELVQGSRLFAIGSLVLGHLPKGFDTNTIRAVSTAFQGSDLLDCLRHGVQPMPCIAVIVSESSFTEATAAGGAPAVRRSTFGALELFTGMHYPVTALPDWKISAGALKPYRAVILPETLVLSTAQAGALRQFVSRGGVLIASGLCGLRDEDGTDRSDFALADVFGVNYVRQEHRFVPNVSKKSGLYRGASLNFIPTANPLAAAAGGEPVGLPGPFVVTRGDAPELFRLAEPMFAEDISKGVFFHWFPPPMNPAAIHKGITLNRFGKGYGIYIPANLFEEYYREPAQWVRPWMSAVIGSLVPDPPLTVKEGSPLGVHHETFWTDRKTARALVLIANTSARVYNAELLPIRGARLAANMKQLPVRSAQIVWPKQQTLRGHLSGETWETSLPSLGHLTAIEINLQASTGHI